jgi:urea transport system permease protein
VYGTLLVNTGKSLFSENFPQLWLFLMGGLFIAVVMLFPNGLAGIWDFIRSRFKKRTPRLVTPATPVPAVPFAKTGTES